MQYTPSILLMSWMKLYRISKKSINFIEIFYSTAPLQGLCFFIYNPLKRQKTMKITINTDVLYEENLSLGDFLALLIGYYDLDYKDSFYRMIETELAAPNVFHGDSLILSDNTKDLVARLLKNMKTTSRTTRTE